MERTRFESLMDNLFGKAGVKLLKKGSDYDDNGTITPYILLDAKRKTYYLAETNILSENLNKEDESILSYFTSKESVADSSAKAILMLSKGMANFNKNNFKLKDIDISKFTKRCALIIDEDNAESVKSFLKERGLTYQFASLNKGQFPTFLLDKTSSDKAADIYNAAMEEASLHAAPDDTSSDSFSFEDLVNAVEAPKDDDDDAVDMTIKTDELDGFLNDTLPLEEMEPLDDLEPIASDEDDTLDKTEADGGEDEELSADDFLSEEDIAEEKAREEQERARKEEERIRIDEEEKRRRKEEIERELEKTRLKDLKKRIDEEKEKKEEQDKKDEELLDNLDLSFLTVKKEKEPENEDDDIQYSNLLNEQSDMIINAPPPRAGNTILNVTEYRESEAKDAEPKQEIKTVQVNKTIVKSSPKRLSFNKLTSLTEKIGINLGGLILFTPAFLLDRITLRRLPSFVVYWLSAIAIVFGFYQILYSFATPFFYPAGETLAAEVRNGISILVGTGGEGTTAGNMLTSSGIFFSGEAAFVAYAAEKWLLHYLMACGALLMIFPFLRKFGASICVFSLLMYFSAPFIIKLQSYIIKSLTDAAASAQTADSLYIAAAGAYFSVFAVPVILIIALLIISGYFISSKLFNKEVLP